MRATTLLGIVLACALATASPWVVAEEHGEPLQRFPQATITVATPAAEHSFRVWVADTPSRRTQGLMYVRSLDPDRGMLFVFDRPQYASFWMRNTYISLDLLFIAADGRVTNISERAAPLSTTTMDSASPVLGVLELAAGVVEHLGIAAGDRVIHPAFAGSATPD